MVEICWIISNTARSASDNYKKYTDRIITCKFLISYKVKIFIIMIFIDNSDALKLHVSYP